MKIKLRFLSYALIAAITTLLPNISDAANWNDPGVIPAQNVNGRWYNRANGQFIGTAGMPADYTPPTTPAPTGTGTGATGTGAGAGTGAAAGTGAKATATKVAKGAGKAVAVGAGAYMIYDATKDKGSEKHNVSNLLEGAAGGAVGGAVFGGWGAVVGAVVGGAIAGSQLFSETDCLNDPATGLLTCCNTAFNKGERYAEIGDYMFCIREEDGKLMMPGVRQCLQGGSATKDTWWNGLWKDDAWSPDCSIRYCVGEVEPDNGITEFVQPLPDTDNICWKWECIEGYTRSGTTCIEDATGQPAKPTTSTGSVDPYDVVIERINQLRQQIIAECGNDI